MSSLYSRLAVAVDDSEPAQRALAFAIRLSAEAKGHLTCVHGVDWAAAVSTLEAGLSVADPTPVVDALRTEGKALVAQACAQARAAGVECDEKVVEDRAAEAVLSGARGADALAIVLGTHGRGGIGRAVLGSVAETVIRTSDVPVLAIHPSDALPPAGRPVFENVLVAVDDAETSDAAVHVAVTLLPKDGHQLTFCTIVTEAGEGPSAKAQLALDRALEYARQYHVAAESCTLAGKAADSILAAAAERRVDLVVLGTHGRTGLERLFSGSVAESVLRGASVPVLIVHG